MVIKSINITSFGGLKNFSLNLSENSNIVYGMNGSGKTTIMNFIKLAFYGKTGNERSLDLSKNLRKKTKPLDGSPQQGSIILNYEGCDYLLEKKFGKTPSSDETYITNLNTGKKVILDSGVEPGEYFTGLPLAQFERCCYILINDYEKLESEFSDIKEFSTTENDASNSFSISILSALDKKKEQYISKSKKKGIIIDKENELNKIMSEIEISLENEKTIKKLDEEFNGLKKTSEELKKSLLESSEREKNLAKLKTLKNLYELKIRMQSIIAKFTSFGLDETKVNEFLTYGNFLLQNTLTRMRLYNEAKNKSNYTEYKKIKDAREKAIELIKKINDTKSKINDCNLYIEKKIFIDDIKKALKKYKFMSLLSTVFTLVFLLLMLVSFNFIFCVPFTALLTILSIIKFNKISKSFPKTEASYNHNITQNDIDDLSKLLEESNDELKIIFEDNIVENFEELTEKYYLNKAEFERSDSESLRILVTESSNKFIEYMKKSFKITNFEDAKNSYNTLKETVAEYDSIKSEYNALLSVAEFSDQTLEELDENISHLNKLINSNDDAQSNTHSIEERINQLNNRMLDIKSEYPRNFKSVYTLQKEKEKLEDEILKVREIHSAIELAESVLKESFNEASHGFIPEINKIASSILSKLQDTENESMIITDDISPKVKIDAIEDFVHNEYMSESERERIYLALRLAIITLIEKENSRLPIIADDILASYDNESIKRATEILEKFSKDRQVIFFTCHDNIAEHFKNSNLIKI